eukprot:CAMPEP_0184645862 /NCGR_PEP_ID=MMETSP0308-20130426/2434_1 /TAXON_ID=38269 /ORGANISM="Gloeochaete witrockiana, Strain SAG 46.84" /LENGTH=764 /DNA_ID=CAMNT_0027075303 /DNA_START=91 /DNA_END=2385 /DNA_ORIENTATION=-
MGIAVKSVRASSQECARIFQLSGDFDALLTELRGKHFGHRMVPISIQYSHVNGAKVNISTNKELKDAVGVCESAGQDLLLFVEEDPPSHGFCQGVSSYDFSQGSSKVQAESILGASFDHAETLVSILQTSVIPAAADSVSSVCQASSLSISPVPDVGPQTQAEASPTLPCSHSAEVLSTATMPSNTNPSAPMASKSNTADTQERMANMSDVITKSLRDSAPALVDAVMQAAQCMGSSPSDRSMVNVIATVASMVQAIQGSTALTSILDAVSRYNTDSSSTPSASIRPPSPTPAPSLPAIVEVSAPIPASPSAAPVPAPLPALSSPQTPRSLMKTKETICTRDAESLSMAPSTPHLPQPLIGADESKSQAACSSSYTAPLPASFPISDSSSDELLESTAQALKDDLRSSMHSVHMPAPASSSNTLPKRKAYAVEFVKDVTIADGTPVEASKKFSKVWRLKNSGESAWTGDFCVECVEGGLMGHAIGSRIAIGKKVNPQSEVDVVVDMTAPTSTGPHRCKWQMCKPSGKTFGVKFWVDVLVFNPISSPSPQSSVVQTLYPSQSTRLSNNDHSVPSSSDAFRRPWPTPMHMGAFMSVHPLSSSAGVQMTIPPEVAPIARSQPPACVPMQSLSTPSDLPSPPLQHLVSPGFTMSAVQQAQTQKQHLASTSATAEAVASSSSSSSSSAASTSLQYPSSRPRHIIQDEDDDTLGLSRSQAHEIMTQHDEALAFLVSMGFMDMKENERVLWENNGQVQEALDTLLALQHSG